MTLEYPETIHWRGLRFKKKVNPEAGNLVSYEASFTGNVHLLDIKLWKINARQWGAKFPNGPYTIDFDMEEVLEKAIMAAISFHQHDIAKLEDLLSE